MVKTPSGILPLFGSAVAVSLMLLLYYEKRKHITQEVESNENDEDVADSDNEIDDEAFARKAEAFVQERVILPESENDVPPDVTVSSSGTSYTSFDDEESKSCEATSSSTSAYSTASDDTGPFPVGEFSTYKQQQVIKDVNNMDLHEILNSPVVENHCTDVRMRRSPTKYETECDQCYLNADDSKPCELESTNLKSIVVAYSDIVPPLKPNTGETIRSSNNSKI